MRNLLNSSDCAKNNLPFAACARWDAKCQIPVYHLGEEIVILMYCSLKVRIGNFSWSWWVTQGTCKVRTDQFSKMFWWRVCHDILLYKVYWWSDVRHKMKRWHCEFSILGRLKNINSRPYEKWFMLAIFFVFYKVNPTLKDKIACLCLIFVS